MYDLSYMWIRKQKQKQKPTSQQNWHVFARGEAGDSVWVGVTQVKVVRRNQLPLTREASPGNMMDITVSIVTIWDYVSTKLLSINLKSFCCNKKYNYVRWRMLTEIIVVIFCNIYIYQIILHTQNKYRVLCRYLKQINKPPEVCLSNLQTSAALQIRKIQTKATINITTSYPSVWEKGKSLIIPSIGEKQTVQHSWYTSNKSSDFRFPWIASFITYEDSTW